MKAGIIAAGWGRRLGGGPKALAQVGGRSLIDLVFDGLEAAAIDHVVCIVNEAAGPLVAQESGAGRTLSIEWIVRTTPSSMHSFLAVLERLAQYGDPWYLMSTVDAICAPETVRSFVRQAETLAGADVVLGLTDVVDDERPVRVGLAGDNEAASRPVDVADDLARSRIVALGDRAAVSPFVTAGLYLGLRSCRSARRRSDSV